VEKEWRAKVKEAKKEHRKAPPKPEAADKPGKFIAPQLTIVDVTIERMCELLVARPQGMVLIIDELAGREETRTTSKPLGGKPQAAAQYEGGG
jgi:hypothetical protein